MTGAIALYMRLSSEDAHEGESLSIGNQRDLLYGFVRGRREFDGIPVLEFSDDGYSGTSFTRPGLQEMLSLAGSTVGCIIVKDFSRFGRNLIEVGNYLDQVFPFLGVRFIAVNEGYDSAEAAGSSVSLDVSLKALVHEMYSRDISEKIRCVQQAKMRKGEYLCAVAFYGYKRSETDKNRLEVDAPAAGVVRRIFQMAADGMAPTGIAAALNRDGVPSPLMYRRANHTDGLRGWKVSGPTAYWTRANVRRIIADERYTGRLVGHKRTVVDIATKQTAPVPKNEWIVAEGTHEAVVDESVYRRAQEVLRHMRKGKQAKKPYQKFRGLLKCACCGRALERTACKQAYFHCPTARTVAGMGCADVRLDEQALENKVLVEIRQHIQNSAADSREAGTGAEKKLQEDIKKCEQEIKRNKPLLAALFEDYAEGRIGRDEYLAKKKEAAMRQEELAGQMAELAGQAAKMRQDKPGPHAGAGENMPAAGLTREMLENFVAEIRASGKDSIEILWK